MSTREPRVVMLVANGVVGDSRVQKIAWSMANAGWNVTLVGRAPGDEVRRYTLGHATVVLVPVPPTVSAYERARIRGGRTARRLRPAYRRARAVLAASEALAIRRRCSYRALASTVTAVWRGWFGRHPGADGVLAALGRGPLGGSIRAACAGVLGLADRYGGWRWLNPWLRDLELAMGPVVRELSPDLIHAHDHHMVGIGARFAAALGTPSRPVRWIYDAHEYLAGIDVPSRRAPRARLRRRMLVGVEREYISAADAVVTVSEGIATRLERDHRLPARPRLVLNAPVIAATGASRRLRDEVGTGPDVPLLLYSGGMSPRRGVATVVDALASLPEAHLALVAREADPDVAALVARAERVGVARRLHVVPYVPVDEVVDYIASATIGVVPILHHPNHEMSLITKYLEYLHARLPIVTSDVREMAAATRRLGVGEVFVAGDPVSFATAVRRVLTSLADYRAVYAGPDDPSEMFTWQVQADGLDALYRELTGRSPGARRDAPPLRLVPLDGAREPVT